MRIMYYIKHILLYALTVLINIKYSYYRMISYDLKKRIKYFWIFVIILVLLQYLLRYNYYNKPCRDNYV